MITETATSEATGVPKLLPERMIEAAKEREPRRFYEAFAQVWSQRERNKVDTASGSYKRWYEIARRQLKYLKDQLPSGSGFDSGTRFNTDASKLGVVLVFNTAFHHMNEGGFYDGWTEHTVKVRADLEYGIEIIVGGRNRNEIKEYIADEFEHLMNSRVDEVKLAEIAAECVREEEAERARLEAEEIAKCEANLCGEDCENCDRDPA